MRNPGTPESWGEHDLEVRTRGEVFVRTPEKLLVVEGGGVAVTLGVLRGALGVSERRFATVPWAVAAWCRSPRRAADAYRR